MSFIATSLLMAVTAAAAGASAPNDKPISIQPDSPGKDVIVAPVPPRVPIKVTQPTGELGPVRQSTGRPYKGGLWGNDYVYTLAPGITFKEVAYWSENIPCYAKIFYPKGFSEKNKVPAVVLGQGWAGTHYSIEKYGERLAEYGLVAMVIDYRGWGASEGQPRVISPIKVGGTSKRDLERTQIITAKVEMIRTHLSGAEQQKDYRNAISYIQGEPGVDPDRIGVWGSSYAGGNALAVAGMDARVKAVSVQISAMPGSPNPTQAKAPPGGLKDAIQRARTGRGGEMETGFSRHVAVDLDMGENNVRMWVNLIARPTQMVVAEHEELASNATLKETLASVIAPKAPTNFVVVPEITHFEMYIGDAFEKSANAAAEWFAKYLNDPQAVQESTTLPPK